MTVVLYGVPHSQYTGRARSYLIKAGIAYREQIANDRHFREQVLPKAGGRHSLPTIELPDGSVIRDSVAIVDHFEAESGHRFSPETPKQRVLSLLFDVIGAEGLLRPAMHYRWDFDDTNVEFLLAHFRMLMPPGMEARAEKLMNAMRSAGVSFGAVPETFAVVETHYEELLPKLDAHFSAQPYLFGGKPSIGDFGMIAPLFAHLGRDPYPLAMMQRYPALLRWVERMNRAEPDIGEFGDIAPEFLADDEVPDTLVDVLAHLAEDFVPETRAAAQAINTWLSEQQDLAPGTEVVRGTGLAPFELRGVTIRALAQPFRFYLLKRAQDLLATMEGDERESVEALLERCGMQDVPGITIDRAIGRERNLEVWV